jgi:hypothetical protein
VRQNDHEFKVSLSQITKFCFKRPKEKEERKKREICASFAVRTHTVKVTTSAYKCLGKMETTLNLCMYTLEKNNIYSVGFSTWLVSFPSLLTKNQLKR